MSSTGGPEWLGLLKWSLAQTDGTSSSEATPMSEEDKEFLTRVMEEGVYNEPKRMKEIMTDIAYYYDASFRDAHSEREDIFIKTLVTQDEQLDYLLNAFDELKDIVEGIDMAGVFVESLKGLSCVMDIILDPQGNNVDKELKVAAASMIGTLAQNNPKVQHEMHATGSNTQLTALIFTLLQIDTSAIVFTGDKTDTDNLSCSFSQAALVNKLMYAVGCSVRGQPKAEEQFILNEHGAVLLHILTQPLVHSSNEPDNNIIALRKRAVFSATSLYGSDTASIESRTRLIQMLVPQVYEGINIESDVDIRESTLAFISTILEFPITGIEAEEYGKLIQKARMSDICRQRLLLLNDRLSAVSVSSREDGEQIQYEIDKLNAILTML